MNVGKQLQRVGLATAVACLLGTGPAGAGELIFRFVNPAFGGNPLNSSFLLNSAQLQNHHKDDNLSSSGGSQTTIIYEGDSTVLVEIVQTIVANLTGSDPQPLEPGVIDTGIDTIVIEELGPKLQLSITNNATGETTSILIPQP